MDQNKWNNKQFHNNEETVYSINQNNDVLAASSAFFYILQESSKENTEIHRLFLQLRHESLQHLSNLIKSSSRVPNIVKTNLTPINNPPSQNTSSNINSINHFPNSDSHAEFEKDDIIELALGSVAKCFGPEFAIFEGRRIPRIPNGDLLLFDRVLQITGTRLSLDQPASIITEFQVPDNAWFFQANSYSAIPTAIIMEMALQPCGFLSAYLGTSLLFPEKEYLFRNLDGHSELYFEPDLRGKTVVNHAHLLSSISGGGTIIQKFRFELSCGEEPFYRGESTFGYFPPSTMANQTGLDKGKQTYSFSEENKQPLQQLDPAKFISAQSPHFRLPEGNLNLLDSFWIIKDGGAYRKGYIYAEKFITENEWFFAYHFYQDPVMPGSLGVEAIQNAFKAYALSLNLGRQFKSPRFGLVKNTPFEWKYRGQIIPSSKKFSLEIHIAEIKSTSSQISLSGDANLWVDGIRIYEIKNAAIRIIEGKK